jgi:hypothetical protein
MHDPRIGRFFAVDPLTAKYPHYSPYSFSGNKLIHKVELEGLEEGDPPLTGQVNAGLTLGFGTKGNNYLRLSVSTGLSYQAGNTTFGLSITNNYYNGGLGTNQGYTFANTNTLETNISPAFTFGWGGSYERSLITSLDFQSPTALTESYRNSLTLSSNILFTTNTGLNQRVGNIAFSTGNLRGNIYNDISFISKFADHKFKGLSDDGDAGHTGGGQVSIGRPGGTNFSFGYNGYTGRRGLIDKTFSGMGDDYFKSEQGSDGHPYYKQPGLYDRQLNNGFTFLSLSSNIGSFTVSHSGNDIMNAQWFQNGLHDNWPFIPWKGAPISRFNNSAVEELTFSYGFSYFGN